MNMLLACVEHAAEGLPCPCDETFFFICINYMMDALCYLLDQTSSWHKTGEYLAQFSLGILAAISLSNKIQEWIISCSSTKLYFLKLKIQHLNNNQTKIAGKESEQKFLKHPSPKSWRSAQCRLDRIDKVYKLLDPVIKHYIRIIIPGLAVCLIVFMGVGLDKWLGVFCFLFLLPVYYLKTKMAPRLMRTANRHRVCYQFMHYLVDEMYARHNEEMHNIINEFQNAEIVSKEETN